MFRSTRRRSIVYLIPSLICALNPGETPWAGHFAIGEPFLARPAHPWSRLPACGAPPGGSDAAEPQRDFHVRRRFGRSSSVRQSRTFTAAVSELPYAGAAPTGGTVTFSDRASVLETAPLTNGKATLATSSLVHRPEHHLGGLQRRWPRLRGSTSGTIATVAGVRGRLSNNGGLATAAPLIAPRGTAVDAHGDVFIPDTDNNVIERVRIRHRQSPPSFSHRATGGACHRHRCLHLVVVNSLE